MKVKVFDDGMSLSRPVSRLRDERLNSGASWTSGEVLTPHGIVSVYAQGDSENDAHTRLDFVIGGRLHMRNFHGKRYSHRGIVTIATKFAAEFFA